LRVEKNIIRQDPLLIDISLLRLLNYFSSFCAQRFFWWWAHQCIQPNSDQFSNLECK